MKSLRTVSYFVLLASLSCLLSPPARLAAHRPGGPPSAVQSLSIPQSLSRPYLSSAALIEEYHGHANEVALAAGRSPDDQKGGIREDIPDKYKARYQEWKKEFLATEMGRGQWELFEQRANFTLKIVISRDNKRGAGTGHYEWDDAGKLVAATITLGSSLDRGYPNPIYYPVMNSLTPQESSNGLDGDILAATKIAHEFGHLTRTADSDPTLYQLQTQLMPAYNKILMSNGRNTGDPQLLDLARQMGGTPVEIWEDREYWGETNAMLYLRDRFTEDGQRCQLFHRIKQRVDLYAKGYSERFLKIAQSTASPNHCGWQ